MAGMVVLLVFLVLALLFYIFLAVCFFAASIAMYEEMGEGRYYGEKELTGEYSGSPTGEERQG